MNKLKIIENNLVPVYETSTGEKVVNGRELHQVLQSRQDFSTWAKKRLTECDAEENKDFSTAPQIYGTANGGHSTRLEYIIKLETAKEMAMLERNEKGKQVRKYFIAVEKKYKQGIVDLEQLDPQTKLMNLLVQSISRSELEQKRQAEQIQRVEERQKVLSETFEKPSDNEDFKVWCKKCIAKIVESPNYSLDVSKQEKYMLAWNESYERLNQKRPCRLKQRVKTAQGEALQNGASKSKASQINALTIIAMDKDLKPVYETVIKEMMICYCVKSA